MRDSSDQIGVIVVGAGAAGLMAAIFAARSGARVRIFEAKKRPGAKIRVSGGGRCNVLPSRLDVTRDFRTAGSIHSVRNVILSWPLDEVRAFFEEDLGVSLETEEATGKVFPRSERSREVVDALLAAAHRAGVELLGGTRVKEVRGAAQGGGSESRAPGLEVETFGGESYPVQRVILATGGLSLPRSGSDGWGLEIANRLGHRLEPTHPVLVALTTDDPTWHSLPGVSVRARLRAVRAGRTFEEREGNLLFTHRGFSGPAVLDLSHCFTVRQARQREGSRGPDPGRLELRVRWGGDAAPSWDEALRIGGTRGLAACLREHLPRRLVEVLVVRAGLAPDVRSCDLRRDERRALVRILENDLLPISGNEGFGTAEATGGGIPLSEIRASTMESRIVPRLHLAGEILDVHGRIGGYNFLWAWVSGRKAGEGAARALRGD